MGCNKFWRKHAKKSGGQVKTVSGMDDGTGHVPEDADIPDEAIISEEVEDIPDEEPISDDPYVAAGMGSAGQRRYGSSDGAYAELFGNGPADDASGGAASSGWRHGRYSNEDFSAEWWPADGKRWERIMMRAGWDVGAGSYRDILVHAACDYLAECLDGGSGWPSRGELALRLVDMLRESTGEQDAGVPEPCYDVAFDIAGSALDIAASAWRRSDPPVMARDGDFLFRFWTDFLRRLRDDGPFAKIPNICVSFTNEAKAGEFDYLSDNEYHALLDVIERYADAWQDMAFRGAGDVLAALLSRTAYVDADSWDSLAGTLSGTCLRGNAYAGLKRDKDLADGGYREAAPRRRDITDTVNAKAGPNDPAAIKAVLDARIYGQEDAKKAAAMVMWHSLNGRRSHVLFCGPTGCGKSEIWRVMARTFPHRVRMMDMSRMSNEGWIGGTTIRDAFEGLDLDFVKKNGLVLVFDEADKVMCERAVGASGTDHNKMVQSSLLKLMDGDVMEFGDQSKGKEPFKVDCSKVSVVFLGAFENLVETRNRSGLGFGNELRTNMGYDGLEVGFDDLIDCGMRREIAGRIGKVVGLSPLSKGDYKVIVGRFVKSGLEARAGGKAVIRIRDGYVDGLVDKAVEAKLGVRWIRGRLEKDLDDLLFEDPHRNEYVLGGAAGEAASAQF